MILITILIIYLDITYRMILKFLLWIALRFINGILCKKITPKPNDYALNTLILEDVTPQK